MKRLITILLVAIPLLAMAQGKTDVTVEAAGQLSQKIAEADRFKISELKISGPLNGADIKLLQQIVNRVKPKEKLGECLVTSVDLSEATIVEGKEGMKTKANELPALLFAGARSLAHVLLPANIINISRGCFSNCESLIEITIPESVTTIDSQAFQHCERLTKVVIPQYVLSIGTEAFEDCKSLTVVEVPASVKDMGTQVFRDCKSLTSASILGNIKKLDNDTFRDCESLTTVTLPETLKEIDNDALLYNLLN